MTPLPARPVTLDRAKDAFADGFIDLDEFERLAGEAVRLGLDRPSLTKPRPPQPAPRLPAVKMRPVYVPVPRLQRSARPKPVTTQSELNERWALLRLWLTLALFAAAVIVVFALLAHAGSTGP